MIEAGKCYKHIHGKDAAIYVALLTEETSEVMKCVVHWVNVSASKHWIMGTEPIVIKKKDLSNWKEIEVKFQ